MSTKYFAKLVAATKRNDKVAKLMRLEQAYAFRLAAINASGMDKGRIWN
jgi:hypothetical protein